MKIYRISLYVLMILFIGLTGCNLAKPPASPSGPVATSTGSSPFFAPAGEVSLAQLYEAHLGAGDWTEGDGLTNLLGMYTGGSKADPLLGNANISDFELTGLIRLADQYLEAHPTGKTHDELQKQLNLLEAPIDRLGNFSRKGSLSARGVKMANLRENPAFKRPQADQAECQSLWESGFSSTSPVICFEYAEQAVGSTSIRLYYPSWWPAGDSRVSRLEAILRGAMDAASTFNTYGPNPLPNVTMVVTELPGLDVNTGRRNADILAMAVPQGTSPRQCYVGVYPSLFTKTVDQSQQALAHELFHCYQYENLTEQEHGPNRSATDWWVEGSAEFFSNVVYPSVNFEHRWLPQLPELMLDQNLFGWSYKAFIFFQYLQNRGDMGTEGILRLLRALPTATHSGEAEQMQAMSAYPNMASIFQGFAEAVADQRVADSDRSILALQIPFYPNDVTEATPGDIFGRGPFAVDIRRVIFPQDFNYDLSTTITGGPGQASAHSEAGPQVWASLPVQVSAGCLEMHYIVVVTQTARTPDNPFEVLVRATSHPNTGTCSCLTGRWTLDNDSYLTHLNGLIEQSAPGSVHYTDAAGNDVVEFAPDGQVTQDIQNLMVGADMNVQGLSTQRLVIQTNGTTEAGFQEVNGTLSFVDLHSQLIIDLTMNDQPLTTGAPGDYLVSGPLGTGGSYTCEGSALTVIPAYPGYSDLPPLRFSRTQP